MFFLVEEPHPTVDEFIKSVSILVKKYHGLTFFEFEEVVDFLDVLMEKLRAIRQLHSESLSTLLPSVRYVPNMISSTQWIDVTVIVDEMPICRIIKAKKEVSYESIS